MTTFLQKRSTLPRMSSGSFEPPFPHHIIMTVLLPDLGRWYFSLVTPFHGFFGLLGRFSNVNMVGRDTTSADWFLHPPICFKHGKNNQYTTTTFNAHCHMVVLVVPIPKSILALFAILKKNEREKSYDIFLSTRNRPLGKLLGYTSCLQNIYLELATSSRLAAL